MIYDGLASRSAPLLRVDQMTGSRAGEIFVCEDIATEEIDMGVIDRDRRASRFLSVTGPQHERSELTGVTFDPSGRRMFFSSQRAFPESELRARAGRGLRDHGALPGRRLSRAQRKRSCSGGRRSAAAPGPSASVT